MPLKNKPNGKDIRQILPMDYFWAVQNYDHLTLVGSTSQDKLSRNQYLTLLADRLQELAENEKQQTLEQQFGINLPASEMHDLADWQNNMNRGQLGNQLVSQNLDSWGTLNTALNEEQFPIQMKKSKELKEIWKNSDLLLWMNESYPSESRP
jgi:type I site-specific restriction endonuclease